MPMVLPEISRDGQDFQLLVLLVANGAWYSAANRQHRGKRRLRHRVAVHAVDVGDDNVVAQRRPVGEIVDAGADALNPFQLRRMAQHMVGAVPEIRPVGDQHIHVGQIGIGLGDVIDQRDVDARKRLADAVVVGTRQRFRQAENEQNGCHAASRPDSARMTHRTAAGKLPGRLPVSVA